MELRSEARLLIILFRKVANTYIKQYAISNMLILYFEASEIISPHYPMRYGALDLCSFLCTLPCGRHNDEAELFGAKLAIFNKAINYLVVVARHERHLCAAIILYSN